MTIGVSIRIERTIKLLHYLDRSLLVAADDDAVGTHKVIDSRALAKEFGI